MAIDKPPSLLRSRLMLAAGFLLLSLILAGAYVLTAMREQGIRQQQHILAVRSALNRTLLTVQDAETGQRGYLLTGQPAYLAPYQAARTNLLAVLHTLDGLVTEPALRQRLPELHRLAEAKQAELARTLASYDRGDTRGAIALVRSNLGMRLMEQIRVLIQAMRAECDRAIAAEQAKERLLSRWVLAGVSASALAILGLVVLTLREISRRHRLIVSTRDELLRSSETLRASVERQAMLEEAVRQSRKMEALGALTGGMAHDFNNMLAVVMGNLELLRGRLAKGERDVGRYIEYALDGARRAAELTQRLLAFARKQPLNAVRVAPDHVVASITEVIRRTLGGIYSVELVQATGLWQTKVDVNQLESALINLAVNARDAMPEGGTLTVQTANVFLDEDYASSHPEASSGAFVMIAVSDSGHGMSEEVRRQAFEPFFTTKAAGKGTGLGLSQVYGFIRQSGGQVAIDSTPGKGTTVRIYLPRVEDTAAPVRSVPAEQAPAVLPRGDGSITVLLVDDDAGVREFAVEALGELGYRVLSATGGHEGLAVLDAHPEIELMLSDLEMSQITGWELADMALRLRPGLKVMLMTGFIRERPGHGIPPLPGVGLLRKPFTLEELAHRIHAVLATDQGAAAWSDGDWSRGSGS